MENLGLKVDTHQKTCIGDMKRTQAPSCTRIGRLLKGNYASQCGRIGYWSFLF